MGLKMGQREGAYNYKGEKERGLKDIGEANSLAYSEECHGYGQRVEKRSVQFTSECAVRSGVTHLFSSSGYGLFIDFCDPERGIIHFYDS